MADDLFKRSVQIILKNQAPSGATRRVYSLT